MNSVTRRKITIITASMLLSIGVLLAAIFLAPNSPTATKKPDHTSKPLAPDELPPALNLHGNKKANLDNPPFGGVHGATYTHIENGRMTQIQWSVLAPQDNGNFLLTDPRAKITFSPNRILTISSDKARMLAPGNQLQKAYFIGHVVATFFKTEDGRQPDLRSTKDIAMRIYLHKAIFDMELSTLSSAGEIYLTGPQVEFQGKGLHVAFNRATSQLKSLVIEHGNFLRLHQTGKKLLSGSNNNDKIGAVAPTDTNTKLSAKPNSPRVPKPKTGHSAKISAPSEKQPQKTYYQAVFFDNVHINMPGRHIQMKGDKLQIWMPSEGTENKAAPNATAQRHSPVNTARYANPFNNPQQNTHLSENFRPGKRHIIPAAFYNAPPTSSLIATLPGQTTTPPRAKNNRPATPPDGYQSLTPRGPDDITVHWSGKLVVTHLENDSADVQKDKDTKLVMTGQPVVINRSEGNFQNNNKNKASAQPFTLSANQFTYKLNSAVATASGTKAKPVRLTAPTIGTLSSVHMAINTHQHTALFTGPGWIHQATKNHQAGMKVSWNKKLKVAFFYNKSANSQDKMAAGFGPIKSAKFQGQVHVTHLKFDVKSALLHISFTQDRQQSYPSHISARGDVIARQQQMQLTAQRLDLTLVPIKAGQATAVKTRQAALYGGQAGLHNNTQVKQMVAGGHVKVILGKQNAHVLADQLIADPIHSLITLIGSKKKPAIVKREDSVLQAQKIILQQDGQQTVTVPGPGKIHLKTATAKNKNGIKTKETGLLVTRWQGSMHYQGNLTSGEKTKQKAGASKLADNPGTITFKGAVVCTTTNKTRSTKLKSDVLKLSFSTAKPDKQAGESSSATHMAPVRRIASMKAINNVVFIARKLSSNGSKRPAALVRLEGSKIDFNRDIQKILIPGKGKMLIQNNAIKTTSKHRDSSAAPLGVALSGAGDTLFAWDGGMVINLKKSYCTMTNNVWMIHKPRADKPSTTLACNYLKATLASTNGITAWQSKKTPDLKLKSVLANGAVRISQAGKQISAGHMKYEANKRLITLWANQGQLVRVRTANQPSGFSAGLVKWDLATDRFEAQKVRGGVIPAG